jgi:hypothetical protein
VSSSTFQTDLSNYVTQLRAGCPNVKIIFETPLTRVNETVAQPVHGSTMADFRTAIATVQGSTSNSVLLDGPSELTNPIDFDQSDTSGVPTHPNNHGQITRAAAYAALGV